MNFTIARILLYVVAGTLLNAGWISDEIARFIRMDPDVQMLAGGGIGAMTLMWWRIAKRFGWST